MTRTDTGETTASIHARADDEQWPGVLAALRRGATLYRPPRLDHYYLDEAGRVGGGFLSRARVRRLEREGVLVWVGVGRYGLAAGADDA